MPPKTRRWGGRVASSDVSATAPVVAAGLVGGYAVARYSGRRELGHSEGCVRRQLVSDPDDTRDHTVDVNDDDAHSLAGHPVSVRSK